MYLNYHRRRLKCLPACLDPKGAGPQLGRSMLCKFDWARTLAMALFVARQQLRSTAAVWAHALCMAISCG